MDYQSLVSDFAQRTRHNLRKLRELQIRGEEVYEVTALMNSLLGLLVFPQQRFMDMIPETPLSQLRREGWPAPTVRGQFVEARDLRELVRYLRNAVAHFNIEFTTDNLGQLSGLHVWNQLRGRRTWEAELTLKDLEEFVIRFSELLERRERGGP